MKRNLTSFGLLSAIFGLFLFAPGGADAVSISPLTFEISANPGEVIENYITVFNNDGAKATYFVGAEDFVPVGEEGSVALEPDAPPQISAKRWVTFEPDNFDLGPGESRDVKFKLAVPLDAEPGGKYTSILVSTAPVVQEGSVGLAQKVGTLLLIRVAGDATEKLSLESLETSAFLEYGPVNFTLRFKNGGTVHLKPAGFIFVKDWLGREAAKLELPQQRVIPGTVRAIVKSWETRWLFGKYTATFAGIYGSTNEPIGGSVSFWVVPWKMLGGIALSALAVLIVFWRMRKRLALASRILFRGAPPSDSGNGGV